MVCGGCQANIRFRQFCRVSRALGAYLTITSSLASSNLKLEVIFTSGCRLAMAEQYLVSDNLTKAA